MSRPANQVFQPINYGNTFNPQQPSVFNAQQQPQSYAWDQQQQPVYANQGYSVPSYTSGAYDDGADSTGFTGAEDGGGQGFSFGDWAKVGQGVANTYLGAEALKLGKEQFGFAKDSFNVNLANQAKLINNEQEARQRSRMETSGQYAPGQAQPDQASLQSDLQSYLKPRQVSGKAI